jgi:hypothetical protein
LSVLEEHHHSAPRAHRPSLLLASQKALDCDPDGICILCLLGWVRSLLVAEADLRSCHRTPIHHRPTPNEVSLQKAYEMSSSRPILPPLSFLSVLLYYLMTLLQNRISLPDLGISSSSPNYNTISTEQLTPSIHTGQAESCGRAPTPHNCLSLCFSSHQRFTRPCSPGHSPFIHLFKVVYNKHRRNLQQFDESLTFGRTSRDRTHIRSFSCRGTLEYNIHHAVSMIVLFLFLVGLVVFFFTINKLVAIVLSMVLIGLFGVIYLIITILACVDRDCPYHTPMSGAWWSQRERLGYT